METVLVEEAGMTLSSPSCKREIMKFNIILSYFYLFLNDLLAVTMFLDNCDMSPWDSRGRPIRHMASLAKLALGKTKRQRQGTPQEKSSNVMDTPQQKT